MTLYEQLQAMPVVTAEQIIRYREAVKEVLREAYKQGFSEGIGYTGMDISKNTVDEISVCIGYEIARRQRIGI